MVWLLCLAVEPSPPLLTAMGGGWNGGQKPEQRDRPSRGLPRPATIDRRILGKEKAPVGAAMRLCSSGSDTRPLC
ncbi:MAG: hypothetical protein DM484_07280 [Candidatus Methylumidiphilus alinenensis]|uniref:Uncharacterized protein n=1 Tax=Candidatus Methylumidiphilus alinenensis TaxID=2202197 RepID=A0A2W4RQJ3_9GAMM|nr:MAG: hypothetical protein DM484_07280 [Candidatus Methylumidiphilus alinenensis]